MPAPLEIPTLVGEVVRLEPLLVEHVDALVDAANEDRSTYLYTRVPSSREDCVEYVADLLNQWAQGEIVPFVQVAAKDRRVLGVTRFLTLRRVEPERPPFAVEIGGTWLAASTQRTGVNTGAKLLLLEYAFATMKVQRVDLKTDARNEQSRAAILRLGARFEGVLRRWQPSQVASEEQLFRDTALYSIVDDEWPGVYESLRWQMARHET